MKQKDNYKLVKAITFDNGVARVYSPVISEEERERRMNEVKKAAKMLLLSLEKQ